MNQKIKKQWVAALRSGKYKQSKGKIRNGNQHGKQYCCLGVLSDLAVKQGVCSEKEAFCGNQHVLSPIVRDWAGLVSRNPNIEYEDDDYDYDYNPSLSSLNDSFKVKFPKIADLIEKSL